MAGKPMKVRHIDRRVVRALAKFGVPPVDIAAEIEVDPKTLRKHFAEELDVEPARLKARVLVALARRAERGDIRAVRAFFKMNGLDRSNDFSGAKQ